MISPALPYLTLVLEPVLADQLQLLVQASLVEGPPRRGVNLEYLSGHCPFLPITTMVRPSEESLKGGRVRPLELPGRVWLSDRPHGGAGLVWRQTPRALVFACSGLVG